MKKFRHLLLILPLLIIFSGVTGVKAESTGTVTMVSYSTPINYQGTHRYYFYLDGVFALCQNLNRAMQNGVTMVGRKSSTVSTTIYKKAYWYAYDHQGDQAKMAAGQVALWAGTSDVVNLSNILTQALSGFGVSASTASQIASEIINYRSDGTLYSWAYSSGGSRKGTYQNLVTMKAPSDDEEEAVCDSSCDMDSFEMMPTCSNYIQNSGLVRQTPIGSCSNSYKCATQKYNISGERTRTYGDGACATFCLQQMTFTYPGNIGKAVNVGTHIVWPNNKDSRAKKINNALTTYPLKTQLEKTCHMYVLDTKFNEYQEYKNTMQQNATVRQNSSGDGEDRYTGGRSFGSIQETIKGKLLQNNFGGACSDFRDDKTKADAKVQRLKPLYDQYMACQSAYGSCMAAKRFDTSVQCSSCGGGEIVDSYRNAQKWANNASERVSKCTAYVEAYKSAYSLLKNINSCLNPDLEELQYSINYRVSYEDPEYSKEGDFDITEEDDDTETSCINCNTIGGLAKIKERPIEVSRNDVVNFANTLKSIELYQKIGKKYYLYDNEVNTYYYYIDKATNRAKRSTTLTTNYSKIDYSNLPISHNYTNFNRRYGITLRADSVNVNMSKVTDKITKAITTHDLACSYKVTKTTPSSCVCPENTKMAGMSLDGVVRDKHITCAEAQAEESHYCDGGNIIPPGDELTCPNDPTMDLAPCVNAGPTYDECVAQFCTGGKNWVCPSGSNAGMDLSACVIPMILQGSSEAAAYEYCKDVTCPYKGIKIIYRVIDLDNPFPSYDTDATVSQKNLHAGMFNDTLKGRYPGSNWNSTTVVKSKILNNRSVDGESVYNKTPLYTFVLDTQKIKAIRQYNRSQKDGYADFTLKCLNGNAACRSSFVHTISYGLVSGTCYSVSKGNFYTCVK